MSPIRRVAAHINLRDSRYLSLIVAVSLGLALWGVTRANTAATSAKSAAAQAKSAATQAQLAVAAIQGQRVDNARIACDDANEANARLRTALLKFVPPHPTAEQTKAIGAFADAIAVRRTKKQCAAFVRARVGHK